MYNIVFPCMMMSSLTVLVFCLPPDSGEKIALGTSIGFSTNSIQQKSQERERRRCCYITVDSETNSSLYKTTVILTPLTFIHRYFSAFCNLERHSLHLSWSLAARPICARHPSAIYHQSKWRRC